MILCCGEALIDMIPRTLSDGGQVFMPVPGGGVFNTAIATGRLGAPVGLFTGLSSDFFGTMLRETLSASGVDFACAVTTDRPTTLAFVRLVDGKADYAFYDENTAGRMLGRTDLPPLPEGIDALFFGGISLVAEPCGSAYEALMVREAAGRVTMLDPNIRRGSVKDEKAYRARLDRMIGLADIVKIADDEVAWLCGEGDIESKAAALLDRGPKLVILTQGAAGACGYMAGRRVLVKSASVAVADTVGAGDTFNAGVLTVLQERGRLSKEAIANLSESDLRAALEFGTAVAAVTVSRAGSNPPWRSEISLD